MASPNSSQNVSSNDPNDAANYVTFDDFAAGATENFTMLSLADRWNAAHPSDRVTPRLVFSDTPPPPNPGTFSDSCNVTRALAAVQLIGGGLRTGRSRS
jgi:hypothetical protein